MQPLHASTVLTQLRHASETDQTAAFIYYFHDCGKSMYPHDGH